MKSDGNGEKQAEPQRRREDRALRSVRESQPARDQDDERGDLGDEVGRPAPMAKASTKLSR
jgi:hypothetical protein